MMYSIIFSNVVSVMESVHHNHSFIIEKIRCVHLVPVRLVSKVFGIITVMQNWWKKHMGVVLVVLVLIEGRIQIEPTNCQMPEMQT